MLPAHHTPATQRQRIGSPKRSTRSASAASRAECAPCCLLSHSVHANLLTTDNFHEHAFPVMSGKDSPQKAIFIKFFAPWSAAKAALPQRVHRGAIARLCAVWPDTASNLPGPLPSRCGHCKKMAKDWDRLGEVAHTKSLQHLVGPSLHPFVCSPRADQTPRLAADGLASVTAAPHMTRGRHRL